MTGTDPLIAALESSGGAARWGRYELRRLLGTGGFAHVFEADLLGPFGFRKPVALKILRHDLDTLDDRILAEARLGARLRHPNIVEVFDVGEEDGRYFFAMEWVDGPSSLDLRKACPDLAGPACLELVIQVCRALAYAHDLEHVSGRLQIVHRDIKPGNVMVDHTGLVKLADFGIAEVYGGLSDGPGGNWGTPVYMAPEHAAGQPVDPRADLFSVGVTLLTLVLGAVPWLQEEVRSVTGRLDDPYALLSERGHVQRLDLIAPGLGRVIARCLYRRAADRYPDAKQLLADLAGLQPQPGPTLSELVARAAGAATLEPTEAPTARFGPEVMLDAETRGVARPGGNLDTEKTSFIGRKEELGLIEAAFASGAEVVSITGPGGCGKTRLSHTFGETTHQTWPGGVWMCDLSEATDLHGVVRATFDALVPSSITRAPSIDVMNQRLGTTLASLGKALMILDRAERVTDAVSEALAGWRGIAPGVRFVVTGVERLGVRREREVALGPLDTEEAIALFHTRLRAGVRVPEDVVRRLVDRLDGLPLAVVIAAGLISDDRSALDEDLHSRILEVGEHTAGLRGMLGWAWSRLDTWEQAALAQLAQFRGGFTVEAASSVLDLSRWSDAPWVLPVIETLLDHNLARAMPPGNAEDRPRFGIYLPVRTFARHQHSPADDRAACVRHGEFFARFGTRRFLDALHAHGSTARWRRLRAEQHNLSAALRRAERRADGQVAGHVALAWLALLNLHGALELSLKVVERALQVPNADPETTRRLEIARVAIVHRQARYDHAATIADDVLGAAIASGDGPCEVDALLALGTAHWDSGSKDAGLQYARRALFRSQALRLRHLEAQALLSVGTMEFERSRPRAALVCFSDARAILSSVGDARNFARALMKESACLQDTGDLEPRLERLTRAHKILSDLQDRANLALVLAYAGQALRHVGRLDDAITCLENALVQQRTTGQPLAGAIALGNLCDIRRQQGRLVEATRHGAEALELARSLRNPSWEAVALAGLGAVLLDEGDLESARNHLERAARISRTQGSPAAEAEVAMILGEVDARLGAFSQARANALAAVDLVTRLRLAPRRVEALCRLGHVELLAGDHVLAAACLQDAHQAAKPLRPPAGSPVAAAMDRLAAALS